MLGLEWQWLLCGYWNVNGYYVGIGKAMVTMWVLEWQWLLCWDWNGNGYYVGIGMAMVTMWKSPQPSKF